MHNRQLVRFGLVTAAGVAGLFVNANWSSPQNLSLITQAEARIGRPLTPGSIAGVNRRVERRTARRAYYGRGAYYGTGAAIGTAAAVGAAGAYWGNQYYNNAYYGNPYYGNAYGTYPGQYYGTYPGQYSGAYAGQYYGTSAAQTTPPMINQYYGNSAYARMDQVPGGGAYAASRMVFEPGGPKKLSNMCQVATDEFGNDSYGYWQQCPQEAEAKAPAKAKAPAQRAAGPVAQAALAQTPPARTADWCAARYRSYNASTGTFLGNDGRRHPCP